MANRSTVLSLPYSGLVWSVIRWRRLDALYGPNRGILGYAFRAVRVARIRRCRQMPHSTGASNGVAFGVVPPDNPFNQSASAHRCDAMDAGEIQEIRELFDRAERESDPRRKHAALEEALDLLDALSEDESELSQTDRTLVRNLRKSNTRRLLSQLVAT